jgi:hypothetical protein
MVKLLNLWRIILLSDCICKRAKVSLERIKGENPYGEKYD